MNFNSTTIIVAAVVIVAVVFLISVIKKARNRSTAGDAENTQEKSDIAKLKESISPIVDEIETQRMAKLISYWSHKFENNTLTVADVESLNALMAAGSTEQVDGILAIHPNGRKMYNDINDELRLKAQDSLAKVNAENAEALI